MGTEEQPPDSHGCVHLPAAHRGPPRHRSAPGAAPEGGGFLHLPPPGTGEQSRALRAHSTQCCWRPRCLLWSPPQHAGSSWLIPTEAVRSACPHPILCHGAAHPSLPPSGPRGADVTTPGFRGWLLVCSRSSGLACGGSWQGIPGSTGRAASQCQGGHCRTEVQLPAGIFGWRSTAGPVRYNAGNSNNKQSFHFSF